MTPIPLSALDHVLTAQIAVAWAGEGGDEPRLGWWRTDLASEFGGEDLFRRLLPASWAWAVLQGAREAARRTDAAGRAAAHDPDRLVTLFRLGFELDERLDERLRDLKRAGRPPVEALPGLSVVLGRAWDASGFSQWVAAAGPTETVASPAGRRVTGDPPVQLEARVDRLVGALAPLGSAYPLPHYRVAA